MQKVDELKSPPFIGDYYLVPCITKPVVHPILEWELDAEGNWKPENVVSRINPVPIINHIHNDKETGQDYYHYHEDDRFIADVPTSSGFRIDLEKGEKVEIHYIPMKCVKLKVGTIAGATKPETFKHKCIHKGKCPHRGYDLSSTPVIDGIITCPLHGLKFDAETKKLIE